jgi:cytoskeletal protein RodZ
MEIVSMFHSKKEFCMTIKLLMGVLVIAMSGVTLAQTATPRVDQREANQAQRIQQGVASGQLTPRETARLQNEQARIQNAEAKAKADGTVTPKESARLERMQNKASRDIAREKHDGQRDLNHDGRKDRPLAKH